MVIIPAATFSKTKGRTKYEIRSDVLIRTQKRHEANYVWDKVFKNGPSKI